MSSIKIRIKRVESTCLVRILISHPMENGRRQNIESGEIIAAHFIQEVKIEHNGNLIARSQLGTAVSRDPYLAFRIREAKTGDSIRVSWSDNLGQSDSEETGVPF